MAFDDCYAVIMAGGRGERFWPLSTREHPKQTLSIIGGKPLIVQAIERLEGLVPPERILVITSAELVAPIHKAAPALPLGNIIGEPMGRDTAAACALGTAIARKRCPTARVCILTADHVMGDRPLFQATLRGALDIAADEDAIVTIGIQPAFPATGFGYIQAGGSLGERHGVEFLRAERFVEKPDSQTAQAYLEAGCYLWNAGMFMWSSETFMAALREFRPPLAEMCDRLSDSIDTESFGDALATEYAGLEKISVDFAIMEHARNLVVARGAFPWYDVGSWPALEDHFEADGDGNVVVGEGRLLNATDNIVVSEGRLTALIGVKDLVVVQADGVTLVCRKSQAQAVKQMVSALEAEGGWGHLL